MQTQSLSTQDLKEILEKVIAHGAPVAKAVAPPKAQQKEVPSPLVPVESLGEQQELQKEHLPQEIRRAPKGAAVHSPGRPSPEGTTEPRVDGREMLLQKQIDTLKSVVKELGAKNVSQEKARLELASENERYKEAIETLTRSQQAARQDAQRKEDEYALKVQASTLDSKETKDRLLRLISDKKELEDTVTSLSCEKATLAARLESLIQKAHLAQDAENTLTQKVKELTKRLEDSLLELKTSQELAFEREKKNQELLSRLEELHTLSHYNKELEERQTALSQHLEALKVSSAQELAVCQACLQERSQTLEEEQQRFRLLSQEQLFLQKRVEEQENHLRLLEQHLARRVKECALLSKQLEEQMDLSAQLQNSLTERLQKSNELEKELQQAKKIENALRIDLESQAASYQDALKIKESELSDCFDALHSKDQELAHLRRIQSQFLELEQLVKRSNDIFQSQDPDKTHVKFTL